MNVIWSDRALKSLAAIHEFISRDSEEHANRTVDRILQRGDQLQSFPLSGRIVAEYKRADVREIVESPYRIVYRVRRDRVQVIEVFHGARRPPWDR